MGKGAGRILYAAEKQVGKYRLESTGLQVQVGRYRFASTGLQIQTGKYRLASMGW